MKVSGILYETKLFWVGKKEDCYVVFEIGVTHSTSCALFDLSEDGLCKAIAYCKYLDTYRSL